jgi:hypothetical protein
MGGALLVAHKHMAQLVLVKDSVVNGQYGAAGITEENFDALVLKRLDDHFGAGHLLGHIALHAVRREVRDFSHLKSKATAV